MDYPLGIQTFKDIINGHFLYIDKTDLVYNLTRLKRFYLLIRPRRFGKSVLISTLEAYFLGKRELFKNLKIMKMKTKWETYPVLRLDLNSENYKEENAVYEIINRRLCEWEKIYGKEDYETTISSRFEGIIKRVREKTGKQVVVLVDEYDKPLVSTIDNKELNDKFREQLKAFYAVIKSQDENLRFAMLTGVTRFSHVSVFSDLNSFTDISLRSEYQALCGITDEEIDTFCHETVEEMAAANNTDYKNMREQLRKEYDGYHFCEGGIGVYNPYSLMNAFDSKKIKRYWFRTGTPTFLTVLLKNSHLPLDRLTGGKQTEDQLCGEEDFRQNPLPVMFQSGYLTITDYDQKKMKYTLGFPNQEVKGGFLDALVPIFLRTRKSSPQSIDEIVDDIYAGDPESFMKRIQTLFASLDYSIAGEMELYFHNSLCLLFWLIGQDVHTERHTSDGRMDATVETDDYLYIFEIKLDGSSEEAVRQIEEKNYAYPFALSGKRIYKIGVNFSSETRGIESYIIK